MEQSKLIVAKSFFDINPIIIGVDISNSFVMVIAQKNVSITEDNAVNLLRLLEINYQTFYQEIEKLLCIPIDIERKILITPDDFPYNIIIRAALTSERDYWIELSLPWLKAIGKKYFVKEIFSIKNNKRVSQRIRHLFSKL